MLYQSVFHKNIAYYSKEMLQYQNEMCCFDLPERHNYYLAWIAGIKEKGIAK